MTSPRWPWVFRVPGPLYWVEHFRGRNNDGDEATATWKAGLDEEWSQVLGTTVYFRVRFVVRSSRRETKTPAFRLQYSVNGGEWKDVSTLSTAAVIYGGGGLNDSDTTQQLSEGSHVSPNAGFGDLPGVVGETAVFSEFERLELEWTLRTRTPYISPGDWGGLRIVDEASGTVPLHKVVPGFWGAGAPPSGGRGDPNSTG